jgi:hypothetical protein
MPKIIKPSKGTFTLTDLSVDSDGRVYSASSGSAGGNFISATGGDHTITEGDYKIHVFKSDANLTVASVGSGNPFSAVVDYMVVGGGGNGGVAGNLASGGGGGAGGYRASGGTHPDLLGSGTMLPVSASPGTYPIVVGAAGGASSFSTITSAGGGGGSNSHQGADGGSGGAPGRIPPFDTSTGNSPPVTPPQGNPGTQGGGGGALGPAGFMSIYAPTKSAGLGIYSNIVAGGPQLPGVGGNAPTGTPANSMGLAMCAGGGGGGNAFGNGGGVIGGGTERSGGDGGGPHSGKTHTGSGGGSGGSPTAPGGTGGAGLVCIRYKYQ